MTGSAAPTTTQVIKAWVKQYAGLARCSTTLPKPAGWIDAGTYAVIADVVGGGPGLYVPENGPIVQLDCYGASRAAAGSDALSRKIPRGAAESLANDLRLKTYGTPAGLELTLDADYRPVWLTSIYPVSEVRELPTADETLARYSVDIFVGWIERNPVG